MIRQMLWLPVAIGVALLTTPARGYELDKELSCRSDPHVFISQLMTDHAINPQPMKVTANSVNAFRPAGGHKLTLPANFVSANRAFIMPLAFSVRRASFVQIASD